MVFLNSSLYFVGLFLLGMCVFPFCFFLSLILTHLSTFLGYIHYQIYCVVSVTSSDGTVSQYQLSFWGAPDSVIQQTDALKLEKTEDEYLLASYDANYNLLDEQLNELTQQENYLNAQIASEQAQISDLQDSLDSMTSAERSQANSRIASLQSQRSQNENTLKTVQQSIADTEQEMAALQEKASVL